MGAALACAASLTAADVQAQSAPYYKGKQINLYTSSREGGGYTVYAHLLERHMEKVIPGNPRIVVMSMPGAGGLRLVNYMYNAAPKDGTTLGLMLATLALAPRYGLEGAQFDATKFNFIGSLNSAAGQCVSWHTSPIKTWQDMLEKEFLVGATGAGSQSITWPNMMNKLFGTKMKVVTGYGGGNDINIAMERGEVHGRCGGLVAGFRATRPAWIDEHKISVPIVIGEKRDPIFPDSPTLAEFAADKDEHTRNVLQLIFATQKIERPFFGPPAMPVNAVQDIRAAFEATMKNQAFLDEAKKLKLEVSFVSGEDVAKAVSWAYTMPKNVLEDAGGVE